MQANVGQGQIANTNNIPQPATQPVVQQPRVATIPVQTPVQPQGGQQYAGVNIQIFNPAVGVPGGSPVYNVNAPSYGTGLGGCYPSNYYTQQFNQSQQSQQPPQNQQVQPSQQQALPQENKQTGEAEQKDTAKKTEKRQIVQLTDNYIKTLENYLNSQDYEVRLMGAKELVARVQEDESRKDDKALTALTNKMLQDPSQQIRILALGLLDSRAITGDDYTVGVLTKMQNSKDGYGQDALTATNILLKMSGKTVEKEFEVKDNPKKSEETKK